jgi:hypothetical protein
MKLQLRVRQGLQKARLFGGAALIMGLDDSAGPQDQPLDLDRVGQGSLKFIHAVHRATSLPAPTSSRISLRMDTRA